MISIGIVGTGIAGLQLGLLLQQRGIPTTIYADRTPEQQRGGRILNNVVRFGHTRERERALGVNHWDSVGPDLTSVSLAVGGEHPLGFVGHLSQPASYVDMRLYQATLLEDFATRGGDVVFGAVQAEDLARLSKRHDLIVVASGRGSLAELFPRVAAYSPYDRPQRSLCLGFFHGHHGRPTRCGVCDCARPGRGISDHDLLVWRQPDRAAVRGHPRRCVRGHDAHALRGRPAPLRDDRAGSAARACSVDRYADRFTQLQPDAPARPAPGRDHADRAAGLCQARQRPVRHRDRRCACAE